MSDAQFVEVEPTGPGDEGDVGGDIQVGTAWGRRFARQLPSGNWAVIDDMYYTVADNQREGREDDDTTPNDIQNQTWFSVCTDLDDVGGTEIYADITYEYVDVSDHELTNETTKALCARLRPENYDWRPERDDY